MTVAPAPEAAERTALPTLDPLPPAAPVTLPVPPPVPSAPIDERLFTLLPLETEEPPRREGRLVPRMARLGSRPTEQKPWSHWRVRVTFLISFTVLAGPLFLLMSWFWHHSRPVHGLGSELVNGFSYIWLILAIPVLLNVLGAVAFRNARTTRAFRPSRGAEVCFRIVTRGTNVSAVLKTVQAVQTEMERTPLFRHSIEIVTDNPLPECHLARIILVPKDYQTETGAKYKARALHYALEASPVSDTTWLFHLDEETHLTPSVVWGIHEAILEEEASGQLRIGQGIVLYHRDLPDHPFLTLADSVRTGDDLGRFRFQHFFGQTAFGMHGSFILVRNDVEKDVGFDLGPAGSVTEDAWWSLVEMARGHRSRWVDGYCLEQSTQSAMDFLKQRRRWFVGLCLVCRRAPAILWHRIALVTSVILWGVGWLGWWSVSIAAVAVNARISLPVLVVGTSSLAAYSALYLLGLELNLDQRGVPWPRRIPWHLMQILLLPAYSLLESAAVIYGVIRPEFDFHIVKK